LAMGGLAAFVFRHRWSPLLNSIWGDVVGIRIAPNVIWDLIFPFRDMTFHVTPKGRGNKGASDRWMSVVIAAAVLFTLSALISGPYGRWDDPYVSVSMFWAALNLLRLLAVLTVLWSSATMATEPRIEVKPRESDGFALLGSRGTRSIAGWRLSEDALHPPSPFPSPAGTLVRMGADRRRSVIAEVLPDGRLQFPNNGARAHLLSTLVALRVDTDTPYRPAAAMRRVAVRMFGLGLFSGKS